MSFGGTGGFDDRDLDRPSSRREPEPLDYDTGAKRGVAKVKTPGILMIVVGVLNLAVGLLCGLGGLGMKQVFENAPKAELQKAYDQQMQKQDAEGKKALEDFGIKGPEDLRRLYVNFSLGSAGLGAVGLPLALVNVIGGILMCVRKAFALAMLNGFVAILGGIVLLPICCYGIVPIAIGIWSLVALFSPDGRAAVQSS